MNKAAKIALEQKARDLQFRYWNSLVEDGRTNPNPRSVTVPRNLIEFLGYRYLELPEIRNDFQTRGPSEVGGLIDRQQKVIAVATKFAPEYVEFTAGHELGHLVLHEGVQDNVLHRDLPRKADSPAQPHWEREASYFGSCILIPRKTLIDQCRLRFGREPLVFDERTCFMLDSNNPEDLLRPHRSEREFALAGARHFGIDRQFCSLAEYFGVSVETMAYRLEDMELIRYP